MAAEGRVPSSFRDPSGHLFTHNGTIYRQVNDVYKGHYDRLMLSGLYEKLTKRDALVPHEEVGKDLAASETVYKIIRPANIPFVSYPYEWCFSQLRDAALLTLEIQRTAMEHGMSLKDGSAYNVQFLRGKPVLIDTLSFEGYRDGEPWVAYRQFCQHFLAPLALMSHRDVRLVQMLRTYIDGIPLDLTSRLLPGRSRFKLPLLTHIHAHARAQKRYADKPVESAKTVSARKMSRRAFLGLIDNLETAVGRLRWKIPQTEWRDYYEDTNYPDEAMRHKAEIVGDLCKKISAGTVWDIGANVGRFSRVAARGAALVVSFDMDPAAVERNYLTCRRNGEENILPLVLDLTNPSPPIGWENRERQSLVERGPADLVLALALIHHLAISNNLPFDRIAAFFAKIARALIIEFVPKDDSQVQRLLASREDVFPGYNRESFETAFADYFRIDESIPVRDSARTVYRMSRI